MSEPEKSRERNGADDSNSDQGADQKAGVNASVAPRIVHRHKGDVGRVGTNEEIYQGSKQKELPGDGEKAAH